METLGLSLSEGKALLAGVQDVVVAQQVYEHLEQRRVVLSERTPNYAVFGQGENREARTQALRGYPGRR
jgi:hypothetical protein